MIQPWVFIFIKFFGLFLFSICLLYILGKGILISLSPVLKISGFYQRTFISLALGVFIIVILSSVIITHGLTISTGLILCGLFLVIELYLFKKKGIEVFSFGTPAEKMRPLEIFYTMAGLIFFALLFFSWQAVMVFKSGNFPFIVPERDYVYYADLSEMLWKTGQENNFQTGNLVNPRYHGVIPYHYFELWLTAFFSWIFKIENLLSGHLLVIPLFFFMMGLGFLSVAETIQVSGIKKYLVTLPLLFLGGFPLIPDISSDYFQWVSAIESPMFAEKEAHHDWIALVGLLFILNNSFTCGFIVFVSMLFVSGTTLPGILGGGLSFLIISFVFKLHGKRELLKMAFYFLIANIYFFIFYFLLGNPDFSFRASQPLLHYTDLSPVIDFGINFFTIKVFLVELAVRIHRIPYELAFVLSPILLVIFFLWKKKKIHEGMVSSLIFICAVYLWAVVAYGTFYKMNDSGQFFENVYFFILAFLSVMIIIFLKEEKLKSLRMITTGMLGLVFFFKISVYLFNRELTLDIFRNFYSDEYLMKIRSIQFSGNPMGIFFHLPPGKERITGRNAQIASRIGGYTDFFPQFSNAVDLSLVEMTNWDKGRWGELEKNIVTTSPFYQYMEDKKKEGDYSTLQECRLDFIKDYKIGFGMVAKGVFLDPEIEMLVKEKIVDSWSGEQFLIFK